MGLQYVHLSEVERWQIESLAEWGHTNAEIARALNRHRSTIGRERMRGLWTKFGRYMAEFGKRHYEQGRRKAGKARRKLGAEMNTPAWQHVISGLRCGHSPQMIAGRLREFEPIKGAHLTRPQYVSHETIYRAVYGLERSERKTELISCLWQSRKARRRQQRGRRRFTGLQEFTPISERPEHVLDRREPGHWEGDLVKGARGQSAIGTLVERTSRRVMLVKLQDSSADGVKEAFKRRLQEVPQQLRRSLTYDRGTEMARHKELAKELGIEVYICEAYKPWQRPSNENTNGVVRRYLPKGMELGQLSQKDLLKLERILNDRPRRVLGYRTANEVYEALRRQHGAQA